MAAVAYELPEYEEALDREKWLKDTSKGNIAKNAMKGILSGLTLKNFGETIAEWFRPEEGFVYSHTDQGAVIQAERITEFEAGWLIQRLVKDGVLHENEKALLRFLRDESPDVHEALAPFFEILDY